MFGVTTSDDYQPLTWVGRHPVHVTTLLCVAHVFSVVLACLLLAFGAGGILNVLIFDSAQVLSLGYVWQLVTYAFVHVPSGQSLILFLVQIYMLFTFGSDVERFMGHRAFVVLYGLLLLVPTVFLSIVGFWIRLATADSVNLHFGIFVAFATIHPNVELFLLRIQTKWIALIFAAIGTLAALAYHDWASIIVLWTTVATAFVFIRLRGIGPELVWWEHFRSRFRRKQKFHVVRKADVRRIDESENVHESIDPVLDKISKYGINSLTPSERRALDQARARLLKKTQ
jgi:hypothetical protein